MSQHEPHSRNGRERAFASWLGFAAGVLNGLIGIGGGIVMVPGLLLRWRATAMVAVGTSLATVTVLSSIAFCAHLLSAGLALEPQALAVVIASGAVGALVGARLLRHIDRKRLLLSFAVFLAIVSTRLIAQGLELAAAPAQWTGAPPGWSFVVLGFASGVFSGVFGVGGGALVVLSFAVVYGMPVQHGLPIALAVNVTNALAGSITHFRAGNVLWPVVVRMIPAAVAGIAAGTALALVLDANVLRIVFGGFFLFMALRLARDGLREAGFRI